MNAYLNAMQRYADFKGRSTRSQYWLFLLIVFAIMVVTMVLDGILGTGDGVSAGLISGIAYIAHFIPLLAIHARRLHDIDKSGWWMLIALVPLVGLIVLIVFACTPSTPRANRFGPNPMGITDTPPQAAAMPSQAAPHAAPLDHSKSWPALWRRGQSPRRNTRR